MQRPYEPPLEGAANGRMPLLPGASDVSPIASIRFVFEDDDWKNNVLMGVLLLFVIPVVGPIVFQGWLCELHQRLVRNHPRSVPRFDFCDFGHYLGRGVIPFLAGLLMMVPIWGVLGLAYVVGAFGVVASTTVLGEPWLAVIVGVVVLAFVFVCLLGLGVLVNAVQTRAELTESLGESLSPHAVLSYARSTLLVVVIKGLAFSVLSVGILLVGLALLCLGAYPAGAVVQIAAAHLRWQIYRHHVDRGGDPITLKEPQPLPSEAARAPFMSGSFGGF